MGLQDMRDRLIRTPLEPYETFKDDPLRVLRLIRFASRLEFTIVPEVAKAMSHPEIKKALKLKISRERIGVEVEKMLYGEHPFEALELMYTLDLYDCIFEPPEETYDPALPRQNCYTAINIVRYLLAPIDGHPEITSLISDPRDHFICWIAAAESPWLGRIFDRDKKKDIPAAASAARDGIKLKNKDFETLVKCFRHAEEIHKLVRENAASKEGLSRSRVGLAIRKYGSEWRLQVFTSLLFDLIPLWDAAGESTAGSLQDLTEVLDLYTTFVKQVERLKLQDAWDFKPLLNGKELQDALDKRPGGWMKEALDIIMEWQLDHPEGGKEEALTHLKSTLR